MARKKQTTEIVKAESPKESQSVESFISQAIASNVPVETLEKIFSLREKVKSEQAKEAFVRALANFQSEVPVINKTKKVLNKDGRTVRYTYAPLDSIVQQVQKPLADHGISYAWDVKHEEGMITAIATVKHALGHSETSSFSVPIDTEGYMTAPQKYASALTFAKRYSLCNALGILTGDEDTDAIDVNREKDALSKKSQIVIKLRALKQKTDSKENIEQAVKKLTQLDLKEENFDEIVSRLQILIDEADENA